jgi:pleiotropic regulator 1
MSKRIIPKKCIRTQLNHRCNGRKYSFIQINQDNVLVSGGDDGTLKFWDWESGYNFQDVHCQPQPGSIAAENGIFALTFDRSGCRLLSG